MTTSTAVDISSLNPGDEVMVKGRFDMSAKGMPVIRFGEGSVRLKAADIVGVEPAATEKKLQLEAGKYYRNRLGEKRGPIVLRSFSLYPWTDGHHSYRSDGSYNVSGDSDDRDLVAEWAEPETSNPFQVGDRVQYKDTPITAHMRGAQYTVAALGNRSGSELMTGVVFDTGGWEEVEHLELVPTPTIDSVVEAVRADLLQRSQLGIVKYGTTLDRTDLSLRDWAQHLLEELMDAALYTKRAILELDRRVAK